MFRITNDAIVLRKINGVLTACRLNTSRLLGRAAAAPSLLGTVGAFLAVLFLPLLMLAVITGLLALHSPAEAHAALAPHALVGFAVLGNTALLEQRQKFQTKQKELADAFELAGPDLDFSRKSVLEKLGVADSKEAIEKVKSRNVELDNLGRELEGAELREVKSAIGERDAARNQPVRGGGAPHPAAGDERVKSFGERFVESKAYLEGFRKNGQINLPVEIDVSMKTLFQTTAGLAPESRRSGLLVDAVTRPIQLLDLIPVRPIDQAVDKYMEETTRTHAAAEKAEGIQYAESTFVWTERTSPVQKITDSIPVTDEQLEDAPQVAGLLDQRLRFGLRQRLDGQAFNGNGTAPNLRGILAVVGIQTMAKGADPIFDAIFKAMMLVRITGRAIPGALVVHPTDWQNVRLTRTADGQYIMGNPSEPGPMSLFGVPATLNDAGSAGTALVGDFTNFSYLSERRGIEVQIGYISTQFVEGKKTLRADLRAALTFTRPAAFCTVTGL